MWLVSTSYRIAERLERWKCPQCGAIEKITLLNRAAAVTRVLKGPERR